MGGPGSFHRLPQNFEDSPGQTRTWRQHATIRRQDEVMKEYVRIPSAPAMLSRNFVRQRSILAHVNGHFLG
jgi:hypothetical protein